MPSPQQKQPSENVRWGLLRHMEKRLELPMAVLGLVWLTLFIIEVVRGSDPLLTGLGTIIWIIFIVDFVARLLIAPDRWRYLRHNWLTTIALVVPALRIARIAALIRVARAARAVRGLRLIRAVASFNRGLGALGATTRRAGVRYVVALALIVCFAGAAGMYALEPRSTNGHGFSSYGDALWWTAMIITTMGSAYWPQTAEGRVLAILISLVAIAMFGYLTATLASFFVGRVAAQGNGDVASGADVRALRKEISELRRELKSQITPQNLID